MIGGRLPSVSSVSGRIVARVPPDREFVGAYCLCKSAGDVRAVHDPIRMLEVARMPLEDLVPVG